MIAPILILVMSCFVSPPPELLETKVYPIQDLLLIQQNYTSPPELDLNAALTRQGNVFRDTAGGNISPTRANPQGLIDIIKSFFGDEWLPEYSIIPWRGNLIVKAPQSIQDRIN